MTIGAIKKIPLLREMGIRWRRWRSGHSYNSGANNKILNNGIRIGTKIQIFGSDNIVSIGKDAVVRDCLIKIQGNNCRINIGRNCFVADAELWIEDNTCVITIGDNTFIGHHTHLACTEDNHTIYVGRDSLISSYVQIRTGDSHPILDMDGNRINVAADVCVGEHCWLGQGSKILKGTRLDHDTVVATGAIVHGTFDANSIIAGVPARTIRTGITWKSQRRR